MAHQKGTMFVAEEQRTQGSVHVLLVATGSVASVKVPLIVNELLKYDKVKVQVAATSASLAFFEPEKTAARVWTDKDEWPAKFNIGEPILHIELRRWADIVLIAPCSANTLSKIAHGLCDNLVTSLLRALSPSTPTYLFPAMNTLMFEHPLTEEHLRIVREVIKYNVVGPISKTLACGDTGTGAMTEWHDIVNIVVEKYDLQQSQSS
ncbi:flavo protein [Cylindrobasidium torrendii FP15055 ss-10]|uniref:Flavo protein n=1 Tax=Cylindrobasidium torrendii FP15055 ss-10 TaxID=1314674 RepID=A0A0D7BM67_9AGAR|nr:flavo protein [Cylindrobasidium torrendii FP15055 ss-10]